MATTLFPLQYLRQNADPIDVDSVFNTTADRIAYLANGRRYPGQVVSDLETGSVYVLDPAGSAWVELGSGGGAPGGLDTQVQFNDGGVFAGNSGFTYDGTTCTVGLSNIGNTATSINVTVGTPVTDAWVTAYGDYSVPGAIDQYGTASAVDSSGASYLAGSWYDPAGPTYGGYIVKFDVDGTLLWQLDLNEPNSYVKYLTDIAVDTAGNIYAALVVDDAVQNFTLIKIDNTLNIAWQSEVNPGSQCRIEHIAVDSTGAPWVLCSVQAGSPNYLVLIKYTAAGAVDWQVEITKTGQSVAARGLALTASGAVVNVEWSDGLNQYSTLVEYDTTGVELSQLQFTEPGTYTEIGQIAVDSAGALYVAACDATKVFITKVESGAVTWSRSLDIPGGTGEISAGLAVDTAGDVYILISSVGQSIYIAKFSTAGSLVWCNEFTSADGVGSPGSPYYELDNLSVSGGYYSASGFTLEQITNNAEGLLLHMPTTGLGWGTAGNYTYRQVVATATIVTPITGAGSLTSAPGALTPAAGSYTLGPGFWTNTTTVFTGVSNWKFNTDGSTSTPNYTLPGGDGLTGQALVTDGSGNVSWGAGPAATPTQLGTVYAYNDTTCCNTFFGYNAGLTTYQGSDDSCGSIAIGRCAGYVGGNYNSVMIGNNAGQQGTDYGTVAIGHEAAQFASYAPYNVFVGIGAGKCSYGSEFNTFIGTCAGMCSSGCSNFNTVIGAYGYYEAGAGAFNVAIGGYSMYGACDPFNGACGNQFNNENVAIGGFTLSYNRGSGNNAVGFAALSSNLEGHCNQAFGERALFWNETGCNNIGIGTCSGYCLVSGSNNTVIGNLQGSAGLECTVLIGSGSIERIKVDDTGLYINCLPFTGAPPATPTSLGTVYGYTTGSGNVAVGCCAGNTTQAGCNNIAIGCNALNLNVTGCNNVAIGACALQNNTWGSANIAIGAESFQNAGPCGSHNIGLGLRTLKNNTASCNIALGCNALYGNTAGDSNIALGPEAMVCNTTGSDNIAIGTQPLRGNLFGHCNVALGYLAMGSSSTACSNIAIGGHSLEQSSGLHNIGMGYYSLNGNSSGCHNIAQGYYSLSWNDTGSNNVAIGQFALCCTKVSNNIGIGSFAGCAIITGNNNTVIGSLPGAPGCVCTLLIGAGTCERIRVDNSGLYVNGSLVSASLATPTTLGTVFGYTTGNGNVGIGCCSGNTTMTGTNNIAIGCNTLKLNATGGDNIAIGLQALCGNLTGSGNIALGNSALVTNCGNHNNAQGYQAMLLNQTGACNIAIGLQAMYANCIGSENVAIGLRSGLNFRCDGNTALGSNSLGCIVSGGFNVGLGFYASQGAGGVNSNSACTVAVGAWSLLCNRGNYNIGVGACAGCAITTGANNTVIGSLPGTAGLTCTALIGAGTCERAKIDNAGLCINGSLLSQGDGLSTTAAGWRITPVNSQSADYPLVADDSGRLIFHPASDANPRTYTIPANGSVAYPVGTTITFANDSSSNITIAITTDTLVLVGSGATGSRTLSQYGVATAVKVESTKWYISGTNLT